MTASANTEHKYARVTRELPCAICGRSGWCMISRRGDVAVCCRVESPRPATQFNGWFHELPPRKRELPEVIAKRARVAHMHPVKDFTDLLMGYIADFDGESRRRAADALGLSAQVFEKYPIGFNRQANALVLPAMQAQDPVFCGVRYRALDPKSRTKWWTEAGTTAGPLLPLDAPTEGTPVFVSEGPSDALAAAQLELHAIARWSCFLDERQRDTVASYLAQLNAPQVIVAGDNDASGVGQRGADSAAISILQFSPHARVMRLQPPPEHKDVRAWVLAGATKKDLVSAAQEVSHAI